MVLPPPLIGLFLKSGAKVLHFFDTAKFYSKKIRKKSVFADIFSKKRTEFYNSAHKNTRAIAAQVSVKT